MRGKNAFALCAALAAFLVVSVFTLGLLTPTLQPVEASAGSVSATTVGWHDLAPEAPTDDGDSALALRHRGSDADGSEPAAPSSSTVVVLASIDRPDRVPTCPSGATVVDADPAVEQVRRC
ncbi:hypothetical protein ACFYYM_07930 [Streptomyces erythrochromogenes]|uniref:hypothetical protein n=1 Tax=Streptomyces erythrochromogenes TaxID=285574 RepID=UPI00368CC672